MSMILDKKYLNQNIKTIDLGGHKVERFVKLQFFMKFNPTVLTILINVKLECTHSRVFSDWGWIFFTGDYPMWWQKGYFHYHSGKKKKGYFHDWQPWHTSEGIFSSLIPSPLQQIYSFSATSTEVIQPCRKQEGNIQRKETSYINLSAINTIFNPTRRIIT